MTAQSVGGRTYQFGIGDRLRVAREMANLSQDDLAMRTSISRQTISNYEQGLTKKPKALYVAAIALATGFSAEWLNTGGNANGGPDGIGAAVTMLPRLDSNQQPAD